MLEGTLTWRFSRTEQLVVLMVQIGLIVVFVVENHNFVHWYKPKGEKVKECVLFHLTVLISA